MTARDRSLLQRWRFAAKPASWPKLLVPAALGQAIGVDAAGGRISLAAAGLGLAFTTLDLLFIVFLNDWGDREVDAIKRRMFPSSSEKTIPDGVLPGTHLLAAGLLAGAGAAAVAFAAEHVLDRPGLGGMGILALLVFVAYTLPPLRLNYRGGGEWLEMLGVAVVLPWIHAYLQSGALFARGLWLLPGVAAMGLASAVASGLSDERSDRAGGKRTVVSRLGNEPARRLVEALTFGGASAWALAGALTDAIPWWAGVVPAAVCLLHARALVTVSDAARTDRFDAITRYKAELHRAIWRGGLVAAALLVVAAWTR